MADTFGRKQRRENNKNRQKKRKEGKFKERKLGRFKACNFCVKIESSMAIYSGAYVLHLSNTTLFDGRDI